MRVKRTATAVLVAALVTGAAAASAQMHESDYEFSDTLLRTAIAGSFLELNCSVPEIQPMVANLTSSCANSGDELIKTFFGSRDRIMSTDDIISPVWGPGQRHKSGTVIFLGPAGLPEQQLFSGGAQAVELVPAYLDVYGTGFIYGNNIPQKPVLATDVKIISELQADVSEYYVFDENEGLHAAESMIADMISELSLPDGFQSSVSSFVQQNDLRLYVYRVHPQHVTTYQPVITYQTDEDGVIRPVLGEPLPVAVPVVDRFVQVALDADKLLAGMEYFWDSEIKVGSGFSQAISAREATDAAREAILAAFSLEPPLISVQEIKLGYVQDRASSSKLVPAWLFDAAYARQATPEEQVAQGVSGISPSLIVVPVPFAVNAITGEMFEL